MLLAKSFEALWSGYDMSRRRWFYDEDDDETRTSGGKRYTLGNGTKADYSTSESRLMFFWSFNEIRLHFTSALPLHFYYYRCISFRYFEY